MLEQLAAHGARGTFFCVGDNLRRYPDIARAALAAGHRLGNHTQHHQSAWATPRAAYLAGVAECEKLVEQFRSGGTGRTPPPAPPLRERGATAARLAADVRLPSPEGEGLGVGSAPEGDPYVHPKPVLSEEVMGLRGDEARERADKKPSYSIASSPPHLLTSAPLFRPPYGRLTWPVLRALRAQDYRVVMWSLLTRDYDASLPPERALRLTLAAARPGDILVLHDSRKASRSLRFLLPRLLTHYTEQGYELAAL